MKVIVITQEAILIFHLICMCIGSKLRVGDNDSHLYETLTEQRLNASTAPISEAHSFILNSRSNSINHKNGLMNSSGEFIGCDSNGEVTSNKSWFLNWEQMEIELVSAVEGPEPTITVVIKSFVFGTYFEIVPFTENMTGSALICKNKVQTRNTSITFKKFDYGYFILASSGKYISFGSRPTYIEDFLKSVFVYPPFNLPQETLLRGTFPEASCRDLDCTRIVLKFRECQKYLNISFRASQLPEILIMKSYFDGYISLSMGTNFITITPNKTLSFDVQSSTVFSLFKIIQLKQDEIALMGYGGKYLECKDANVYISDNLSIYSRFVSS